METTAGIVQCVFYDLDIILESREFATGNAKILIDANVLVLDRTSFQRELINSLLLTSNSVIDFSESAGTIVYRASC
jgi:hypothetical protein